eukprot:g46856.t1
MKDYRYRVGMGRLECFVNTDSDATRNSQLLVGPPKMVRRPRRVGKGQLREDGCGYTFFWRGKPEDQPRMHGMGFAIKNELVNQLLELPVGINDRLRLQLAMIEQATIVWKGNPTLERNHQKGRNHELQHQWDSPTYQMCRTPACRNAIEDPVKGKLSSEIHHHVDESVSSTPRLLATVLTDTNTTEYFAVKTGVKQCQYSVELEEHSKSGSITGSCFYTLLMQVSCPR